MKNNSEPIGKTPFSTSIPEDQKRALKTIAAMTGYSIEQLTTDAFALLLGIAGKESMSRNKTIRKAVDSLSEDLKPHLIASCVKEPLMHEFETCTA